ncbi:MAG: hypothetical protein ACJA0Q_000644 [Saprospiraceae bacterium]|jgi:hypothetical protein
MKINSKKEKIGYALLISLACLGIIALVAFPSLKQDLGYHVFSDQEHCCKIPNFWNVISNLPFLLVGLLGLKKVNVSTEFKLQKQLFFIGISLVSFGSGYYHWSPNNETLVWDRLPMTIAFMALFSIIIGEFINEKAGNKSFIPLLLIGIGSVIYWVLFDDLKFYALVQFYPMLAIPVILIFFKSKKHALWGYWTLLIAYIMAKIFEHFDFEVHSTILFISGHSIKHLVAAAGVYCLLYYYQQRDGTTNK